MKQSLALIIPILALMIPIISIVMKNWRAVQDRRMDLVERQGAEISDDARIRIEKLEARVSVLERIATDRRIALADEIDRLGGGDTGNN